MSFVWISRLILFFYFPSVRFLVCLVLTNAFRLKISSTLIFEWNQMILIGHKINVFACWLKLKQETTMCHHKVESDNHLMFLLFSILFDVFWLIIYYLFYSLNFSKILFFCSHSFRFFTTIAQQWLHLGLLKFCLKKWLDSIEVAFHPIISVISFVVFVRRSFAFEL